MNKINYESPSVQSYLSILQSVINRMAANSASCKTWCITLVSAIAVVISDKGRPKYVWIAIVPIALFFFLDSYYLGLEQRFRNLYNEFIKKLHDNVATIEDVFIVMPGKGIKFSIRSSLMASFSVSIWPFYGLLVVMLYVIHLFVL